MIKKLLKRFGFIHKSELDLDVFKASERLGITIEELSLMRELLKHYTDLTSQYKDSIKMASMINNALPTGCETSTKQRDSINKQADKKITKLEKELELLNSINTKYKPIFKLIQE